MTTCVFLAGIVMPASLRYEGLFRALGDGLRPVAHELALYEASPRVPDGYSIDHEVEALHRAADVAGIEAFHLYGHSGGGAVALAYAAAHPERLLSLALDEPSSDFSDDDFSDSYWSGIQRLRDLPIDEQIPAFRRLQVEPGLEPPALREPRPSWMTNGPSRIAAFSDAVVRHRVAPGRYRAFRGPVYYSYGSRTHPRHGRIRERLAGVFADFRTERHDGLHHLESAHQVEPGRVAASLERLWKS